LKEVGLALRRFVRGADLLLLFLCLCCSAYSLVVLSSAAKGIRNTAGELVPVERFLTIQLAATIVGVIVFLVLTLVNLEWLCRRWPLLLAMSVGMMGLLLVFGEAGGTGNRAWLYLPGVPIGIQPAEFVKLTFILTLAYQMYTWREKLSHIPSVALLLGHLGFMLALVRFTSRDDGMVLVYIMIFVFMCLAAGLKWRWFAVAAALVGVSVPVIWNFLPSYQKNRVLIALNPDLDPLDKGYHAIMSRSAIGAGKLLGMGLGQGEKTQSGALPAKHTDFIFSVVGEELGFLGCALVMLLLTVIILRVLVIATRAKSGLGAMVCAGVGGMLIFQTFWNIGMCMGILPIVGLTLPLFSYGGSSTLSLYAAMGLVSAVRMHPMPEWEERQIRVRSRGRN
jgi:rod shape determining protein RodA